MFPVFAACYGIFLMSGVALFLVMFTNKNSVIALSGVDLVLTLAQFALRLFTYVWK